MWFYHIMCPKDTDKMAISVDPDQQSGLGVHCLPRLVRPKFRIITVSPKSEKENISEQK